jgi:anti-sigma regulatory factor (Ser/Thr protein kinase)
MTNRDSLRHEALIYHGEDDFLAGAVPFLWDALEAGEPALVAVGRRKAALLRGELGAEADALHFAELEQLGRNPARIIPFLSAFAGRHGGAAVRVVGEPLGRGSGAAEIDECQRHEALVNTAFGPGPVAWSMLCSYDGDAFDEAVLNELAHSHPVVEREGERVESSSYEPERNCFAGALPPRGGGEDGFKFDRTGLFEVRQRVTWAAKSAGVAEGVARDLVVAASELAANSIVHGGGTGTLHVWREGGRLLVEVEDRGEIEEPLVGRVKPEPTQVGGRGLWLANQFCDLVQIRSGPTGTTVRLHIALAG